MLTHYAPFLVCIVPAYQRFRCLRYRRWRSVQSGKLAGAPTPDLTGLLVLRLFYFSSVSLRCRAIYLLNVAFIEAPGVRDHDASNLTAICHVFHCALIRFNLSATCFAVNNAIFDLSQVDVFVSGWNLPDKTTKCKKCRINTENSYDF